MLIEIVKHFLISLNCAVTHSSII